jgi:hypothetical protein
MQIDFASSGGSANVELNYRSTRKHSRRTGSGTGRAGRELWRFDLQQQDVNPSEPLGRADDYLSSHTFSRCQANHVMV